MIIDTKRYKFLISTIRGAGALLLKRGAENIEIRLKNNNQKDIVTNIDIEIENFIIKEINKNFRHEVIYSEESPNVDISTGSFWTIDPIDGTSCFSRNIPHFAIVVGYVEGSIPAVGAIFNPVSNELFSFQRKKGAYLNGKRVRVSRIDNLALAHIFFRAGRKKEIWDWGIDTYKFLLNNVSKTSNFGSSALDLCFVGAGKIEACIYGTFTTLDVNPAIGFVQEAGGIVVDQRGKEITQLSKKPQVVVAVNNKKILSALKHGGVI